MKEQSFFHDALQTYKREWIRFDQHTHKKKHLTCKALSVHVTLKKLKTFYHLFKTLALFSRLFPGLKNCWANFKTFSRIPDSVRTLCTLTNLWNHCLEHHSFLALVRQYMKASHTASHASCLIQDGGKKCSCINLYSPCLQSKSWGFHNLAKTFMYPIVYCIVALVLQFAYYYGKRCVVGL